MELKNKRTTSPKGGKDWVPVKFQHLIHVFLQKERHFNLIMDFYKYYVDFESKKLTSAHSFLLLGRWSFCFSSQHVRGNEVVMVFSQGTDDSKNLRCETLYIGNYKYVNISSFAVLGIKLWLEEDSDLNRNDPLYSLKFIQSKAKK